MNPSKKYLFTVNREARAPLAPDLLQSVLASKKWMALMYLKHKGVSEWKFQK